MNSMEEITRLEQEVESRLQHITYLKTHPENISNRRKSVRILEDLRRPIQSVSGSIAIINTVALLVAGVRSESDGFLWFLTILLWLNFFLFLNTEYYNDPPKT